MKSSKPGFAKGAAKNIADSLHNKKRIMRGSLPAIESREPDGTYLVGHSSERDAQGSLMMHQNEWSELDGGNGADFDSAFEQYTTNPLLRAPFWQQQFHLKKKQRDHILSSYHLVSAEVLKTEYFPGWGAGDPVAAMNKRADRNQVLCIMVEGQRLYPTEQFNPKADTPKLAKPFSEILNAFAAHGDISQEEFLFWLCSEQTLLLPAATHVDDAINTRDLEKGWEALRSAPATPLRQVRPLDCLLAGDKETALRLFYDWTEAEQDGPAHDRQELIAMLKEFMAVERISIDDLKQG